MNLVILGVFGTKIGAALAGALGILLLGAIAVWLTAFVVRRAQARPALAEVQPLVVSAGEPFSSRRCNTRQMVNAPSRAPPLVNCEQQISFRPRLPDKSYLAVGFCRC